ncbi:MAG: DUF1987 domain-containing protein [Bacteroidetes bacterium]|nr:MAG: DUF1987 domain-containing protein [Bacteroidota bacterium]
MQKLEIAPTRTTLGINFDPNEHLLEFYGNSYPTNPVTFFQPLMNWVEKYLLFYPSEKTKLLFRMDYFNTSSSTFIFKILAMFDVHHQKFGKVELIFECSDKDDDVIDSWKSLLEDLNLPCKIKIQE